jgi:hypothetical protein
MQSTNLVCLDEILNIKIFIISASDISYSAYINSAGQFIKNFYLTNIKSENYLKLVCAFHKFV